MTNEHNDFRSTTIGKYQFGLLVAIVAIASLAGGAASARLAVPRQHQPAESKSASEFIVPPDGLLFKTPEGKLVAKLSFEAEGGKFIVYNQEAASVAGVYSSKDGGVLIVFNNHGVPKLFLNAHEDSGNMALYGKYGKLAIAMSAFGEGGSVDIYGPSGDRVLTLEAQSKSGKVEIMKSDGSIIWSAP